ncbi:methyltransferase domain-containing protein [Streptomyces sp. p1417]|uniref:Methyltransferase domain-containing protein n=1 Tax=Streptomyces typhae TaxID=2681492 RepID=A0A6L6WQL0_9ACTN|nr:methyltransferase domain-containing protein [Streptomyces typhae]
MPLAPQTPAEYWDTYKPNRGDGPAARPQATVFEWTQYPGHGPGAEFLGAPLPQRALDLGPAEGAEAAYLARQGVHVTGVDLSAVQVARARTWWQDTARLEFVHADAVEYLASTTAEFDAVYSVWGACWFIDPDLLLPLIARRLAPGGVLAFSHAEPTGGAYGPQPMRGKWLEGRERELIVLRWQYSPPTWADILKRHGFTDIDARVLPAPDGQPVGTLLVRATQ